MCHTRLEQQLKELFLVCLMICLMFDLGLTLTG